MKSLFAYIASVILLAYAGFFFYPKWEKSGGEAAISWDASGYYWYLPSVFIYHDLKHQSFKDSILKKYQPTNDFQQGFQLPNGNWVMKYSSGTAFMFLPFFTVANLLAKPLGYPPDGFSPPYQLAISLGGFLWAILGLWFLRRLLLRYFSDWVTAITILILVFGTNYLDFSVINVGMSHSWIFTLYVFLLIHTDNFYKTFKRKYAVYAGLLVGLATLTRPTDIVSCIIPMLWGMNSVSWSVIKERFIICTKNYISIFAAVVCAGMVMSFQAIYWKYVSGHWIVYSYGNQGFSWKHPHIFLYMLNYQSGWLTYTPMMFLTLAGVIPFLISGKNRIAILVFILLDYYIVSAWDIWTYGGRAMVQSYPVLMFPLAALIQESMQKKWLGFILIPFVLIFIYFNVWITYHYHKGGMYDTDCMTKKYFWRVVGRWEAPPDSTIVLRDNTDLYEGKPEDMVNVKLVYENDFETDTTLPETADAIQGKRTMHLYKEKNVTPKYTFAFSSNKAKWLRMQATYRCIYKEWDVWNMAQTVIRLKYKGKLVSENMQRVYRSLNDHETKNINVYMLLPDTKYDSVTFFIMNWGSEQPLWIDNIKFITFDEKKK